QRPHPPIRVAVHSAESFAHIGGLGLPIYSGTTTTPLTQLREFMALYRERLAAGGHAWQPEQMALMLPVHVGETGGAARDAMRPGVRKYYENLRAIFSALPDSYVEHLPRLKIIQDTLANLPYDKFFRDQAVFGDPAEVIDRLQAVIEEFSLSQVICWFDQGSMLARAVVEATMSRFVDGGLAHATWRRGVAHVPVGWCARHHVPGRQVLLGTAPAPSGAREPWAFALPRSAADLRAMGRSYAATIFLTAGNMTHTPGYRTLSAP